MKISLVYFSSLGYDNFLVHLAEKLAEQNCLHQILVFSQDRQNGPSPFIEPFPNLRLLHRIAARLHVPYHVDRGITERIFDIASLRLIDASTDLLLTGNPVIPRSLRKAKRLGITTVLLAANPHDLIIARKMALEETKWGVRQSDSYTSEFKLAEIRRALPYIDYVLAATSVVAQTYKESGFAGKIVEFNFPYGPDLQQLSKPEPKQDRVFRVGYLGHSFLLKGLQYLLAAWEQLQLPNSELVVGGASMTPGVQNLIRTRFAHLAKVSFVGHVKDINAYYRDCSIVVCPSLIDGGPKSVYEAMACGLPVIVTDGCGARDVIRDGREGFVVPHGDAGALVRKIQWCYDHPQEITRMGRIARETVSRFPKEGFAARIGEVLCEQIVPEAKVFRA